jgi:hypothetical protein
MAIRVLLVVFLMLAAATVFAKDVERATSSGGMTLTLTDSREGCEQYKEAKRSRLDRGREVFLGCYVKAGGVVFVQWDDGDRDQVPASEFKAVQGV